MVPLVVFLNYGISGTLVTGATAVERHGLGYLAVADISEHGPTINPAAWLYRQYSTTTTTVLEYHAVPLSVLSIHDGTLTNVGETTEFTFQDYLHLVRTFDVLAAISQLLTASPWP